MNEMLSPTGSSRRFHPQILSGSVNSFPNLDLNGIHKTLAESEAVAGGIIEKNIIDLADPKNDWANPGTNCKNQEL